MKQLRRRLQEAARNDAGFSLMEMLTGLFILGIILSIIMTSTIESIRVTAQIAERTEIVTQMNTLAERLQTDMQLATGVSYWTNDSVQVDQAPGDYSTSWYGGSKCRRILYKMEPDSRPKAKPGQLQLVQYTKTFNTNSCGAAAPLNTSDPTISRQVLANRLVDPRIMRQAYVPSTRELLGTMGAFGLSGETTQDLTSETGGYGGGGGYNGSTGSDCLWTGLPVSRYDASTGRYYYGYTYSLADAYIAANYGYCPGVDGATYVSFAFTATTSRGVQYTSTSNVRLLTKSKV
jgi:prepilin-type N-terminal cleavage/methylation domain-containing protein